MYRVLEFDGESGGGLGLVREEWLTPRKQQCYWPPFKLSQQYNKALIEGYQPDEKWSIFNIARTFYCTDDILIARKKLKLAEEESDVVTDSETVNVKRKRKKNYKYISIDEHDDEDLNNHDEELICVNETNFDCGLNDINKEQISDDETSFNSVSLLDSLRRIRKPSKNKYPLPPRHSEHPQLVETSVSDDVLIARKKLKLAEEESDVTDSETVNVKRKRKKNYKYISIDEHDDGDLNNHDEELMCDNETNFDCGLNNFNKEKISDDETSFNSVSLLDSLKRIRKPSKNKYPLPSRHSKHPQLVETSVSVGSAYSNSFQKVNSLSPCSSKTSYDCNCISQKITEGFNVIAKHLGRLEKRVDDIICKQDSVLRAALPQTNVSPSLPSNIKLPCETHEHLLEIENWLSDNPDNETSLKIFLSVIGGKTVHSIVRRCLEKLFTNQLAIQYNWTGKNNKKALKTFKIVNVLCDAVRINKNTASDDEIQIIMKSWFRFTKDRDGGREARRREPCTQ